MFLLVYVIALAGCRTPATYDVNSFAFIIPRDSKLTLKQPLSIPTGSAHIKFQQGKQVGGVDEYTVNCQFRVKNLGPQDIQPDTFLITNAGDGEEWVSAPSTRRFFKNLFLKSDKQPEVMTMICQVWAAPPMGRSISVPQMREALGDYFSFEFAETAPSRGQGT
jgi:hypothetical protein